jgi:hypothetical protein
MLKEWVDQRQGIGRKVQANPSRLERGWVGSRRGERQKRRETPFQCPPVSVMFLLFPFCEAVTERLP